MSILILGDAGVGKSSFINTLKGLPFTDSYVSTIGKDLFTYQQYYLHDMPGHSRWTEICRQYYPYAQAAIIVYDLADSSDTVTKWKEELAEYDIPIVVVGNKSDLSSTVSEHSIKTDVYISCKTGENVDKVIPLVGSNISDIKVSSEPDSYVYSFVTRYCCLQ